MVQMSRSRFRNLVALNAVLLGALTLVTLAPRAEGQGARARGSYTMVPGKVQGSTEEAIFIFDNANAEFIAVLYDRSRRSMTPIGYRNVTADAGRPPARVR